MDRKIRILGILPYEGMKPLMASLEEEFPSVDLTLFVGDMEKGLEIAKNNFHGDYDVVISRGGTAKMLRQNLTLPVIEIQVSMYDLLCALKLADAPLGAGKVAMVSFDNIASNARLLCDLMGYDINIYSVAGPVEVEATLTRLQEAHCGTILCDVISNTTAKSLGMNSILITSGIDSIRQAFERALFLCRSQERLRQENLFFRELLNGQIGQTLVFDDDGTLFLSTLDNPAPELLELLRNLAEEKHATPVQISLSWMLCKKPYIVPIPGSRKVERMRENAGAAEVILSPAEVETLDKTLDTIPMSAVFGGTKVVAR